MRGWRWSMTLPSLALAGCIPQVAPPERAYPAPPSRAEAEPGPSQPEPGVEQDQPARDVDLPPSHARGPVVSAPPQPRPAWEARPVTPDARTIPDGETVVAPGETLSRVAERTAVSADAIARANDLEAPYAVRAGQRLRIPGGRYHLVRPGQSGIAIARAYGVPWSAIVAANQLSEPYVLRAGQRVLIPGGDRPASAAERAAAFQLNIDDILTGGEPALASDQAPSAPVSRPDRVLPSNAALAPPPARLRGGFLWPVDGRVVKAFGRGSDEGVRNDGIGIAAPVGTPVKAVADGVVAYAGSGIQALGGLVIIRHGDRWTSVYGYCSRLKVQRGQSVHRGDVIALSGDTGGADRPELHFELRKGRTPVDPQAQLPGA